MIGWLQQLSDLQATLSPKQHGVMITVARVRGSAPREVGARMWVTADITRGTIGGGELEYQCQAISKELLERNGVDKAFVRNFPLGSNCGQCCGGVVDILFETFKATPFAWQQQVTEALAHAQSGYLTTELADQTGKKAFSTYNPVISKTTMIEHIEPETAAIAIFGTGHVGTALVNILTQTNYRVNCIDNRPHQLPLDAAANIQSTYQQQPASYVSRLAAKTACVVMTHNHALDFDICASMLKRDDLSFYGLIGSQSKRQRFQRLFRQAGLDDVQINRLTCPVGDTAVTSKRPGEIAITIAAQLLRHLEVATQTNQTGTTHAAIHR